MYLLNRPILLVPSSDIKKKTNPVSHVLFCSAFPLFRWAGFHQPMLKRMNELKTILCLTSSFRDCKNLYLQCVIGLVRYLNSNISACLNLPVLMLGFIQKFGLTGCYPTQSCARNKLPVCHHGGLVQSPTHTFPEDLWKTKFFVPFHFTPYYTMSTSNGRIFNVSLLANICDGTRR